MNRLYKYEAQNLEFRVISKQQKNISLRNNLGSAHVKLPVQTTKNVWFFIISISIFISMVWPIKLPTHKAKMGASYILLF